MVIGFLYMPSDSQAVVSSLILDWRSVSYFGVVSKFYNKGNLFTSYQNGLIDTILLE